MSIGNLLLRPQMIEHASGSQQDSALRDMWEFLELLGSLKEEDLQWVTGLLEEIELSLEELRLPAEQNLSKISLRLRGPIDAFVEQITDMFGTLEDTADVDSILAKGAGILTEIAILLETLNKQSILNGLDILFDIIEKDLGFSADQLSGIGNRLLDRIIQRLKSDKGSEESGTTFSKRQTFARSIEKIRKLSAEVDGLPAFGKESILPIIESFLDDLQLEEKLQPISDRIREVAQILIPVSAVLGTASLDVNINVNATRRNSDNDNLRVKAANIILRSRDIDAEKVCWYASWLYNRPIKASDPIQRLRDDKIDFGSITAEKMEAIAFHSKWIANWLEVVPHIFSIAFDTRNGFSTAGQPQRTFLSNALNSGWHITNFFLILLGKTHIHQAWHWLAKLSASWLGSYAVPHFRYSDPFGILVNLLSVAETQLYARWTYVLREGLLSILTLINHKPDELQNFNNFISAQREAAEGDEDKLAQINEIENGHNQNQVFGFTYLLSELGILFFALGVALNDKDEYGWSDGSGTYGLTTDNGMVVGRFFIAFGIANVVAIIGLFTGAGMARKLPNGNAWVTVLFKTRMFYNIIDYKDWTNFGTGVVSVLSGFVDYVLGTIMFLADDLLRYAAYYFILQEGKSENGTYLHPTLQTVLNGRFSGYQNRAISPYLLPYPSGEVYLCAQGHVGSFSHTPVSVLFQTYAVDFNMDANDTVVACRSGILWTYFERRVDRSDDSPANSVRILHHTAPNPAPGNPVRTDMQHDVFIDGTARRTSALYLHGMQGSVTRSFRTWLGTNRTIGRQIMSTLPTNVQNAFRAIGINTAALAGTNVPVVLDTTPTTPPTPPTPISPVYVLQGQAIMESGDTGRSAYNHLHMHINPSMNPGLGIGTPMLTLGSPAYVNQPLGQPNFATHSIPFVFNDIEDDGVPKTYIHYEASTVGATITAVANVDDPAAANGDTVTITITVTNTGPNNAINILIQNIIPSGFTYDASTITGGDVNDDTNDPFLIWRIHALNNSATSSLTFQATRTADPDVANVTQVIGRETLAA